MIIDFLVMGNVVKMQKKYVLILMVIGIILEFMFGYFLLSYGNKTPEPFSVLLIGTDSTQRSIQGISSTDSIMLATVNPKNLSVTLTSIPRDSYVNITCMGKKDKLLHASDNGIECLMDTVSTLLDIEIPYYMKINFKGFVNLVDILGGVYVYVPEEVREQNSDRSYQEMVVIEPGYQSLNGEAALAFARHRENLSNGDLGRAVNQQTVLKATISKLINIDNLYNVKEIYETLSDSIEANISIQQISEWLTYIFKIKNVLNANCISFQSMVLPGEAAYIYNESMQMLMSCVVLYQQGIEEAKEFIKINLNQVTPDIYQMTSFTYNPNFPHFGDEWVNKYYDEELDIPELPDLIPNFVKEKWFIQDVLNWGMDRNVEIIINEVVAGDSKYDETLEDGIVINQSQRPSLMTKYINQIEIDVIKHNGKD